MMQQDQQEERGGSSDSGPAATDPERPTPVRILSRRGKQSEKRRRNREEERKKWNPQENRPSHIRPVQKQSDPTTRSHTEKILNNYISTCKSHLTTQGMSTASLSNHTGTYSGENDLKVAGSCVFMYQESAPTMVLVSKRKARTGNGMWQCPGGKIEMHETPMSAIIREVYEETGLVVSRTRIGFQTIAAWVDLKGELCHSYVFRCMLTDEECLEVGNPEPDKQGDWGLIDFFALMQSESIYGVMMCYRDLGIVPWGPCSPVNLWCECDNCVKASGTFSPSVTLVEVGEYMCPCIGIAPIYQGTAHPPE